MHVETPATCGNAPRHQIIMGLLAALHGKDLAELRQWLAEDVVWECPGEQALHGRHAVEQWVQARPETSRVLFLSILTHGKEGSADGIFTSGGRETPFSHVLRFASAGKTAKLVGVRSYFAASSAAAQ
ncbi:SnoaL-like protein [Glutamicibacter mysorens]|uniref:SnoaL-like protein n=1 Tax=Glutamicibacter mysorens TaxID=257984 RepID=A0ABX4N1Q1_9MICC|nr:nuclear transport factor 2 family protein [Glutamicibacter mysorens]PJJ45437.1 SnoaL-like protein [Glutamicibacter mysorens]